MRRYTENNDQESIGVRVMIETQSISTSQRRQEEGEITYHA